MLINPPLLSYVYNQFVSQSLKAGTKIFNGLPKYLFVLHLYIITDLPHPKISLSHVHKYPYTCPGLESATRMHFASKIVVSFLLTMHSGNTAFLDKPN